MRWSYILKMAIHIVSLCILKIQTTTTKNWLWCMKKVVGCCNTHWCLLPAIVVISLEAIRYCMQINNKINFQWVALNLATLWYNTFVVDNSEWTNKETTHTNSLSLSLSLILTLFLHIYSLFQCVVYYI